MQVRFQEAAIANVAFAISSELHDVLAIVLSEADDDAAISPAFCLRALNDDGLTRVKDGQLVLVLIRILVKADLAEATFDLGAKSRFVVIDRCGQTILDFAAEEKLGRRVTGRLARRVVVEQNRLGPFMRVDGFELAVVGAVNETFHLFDAILCDSVRLAVIRR